MLAALNKLMGQVGKVASRGINWISKLGLSSNYKSHDEVVHKPILFKRLCTPLQLLCHGSRS